MKRRSVSVFAGLAVGVLALAVSAHANNTPTTGASSVNGSTGTYAGDGPAVSFTSTPNNYTDDTWSLGFQFTTNQNVNVTGLGFYNATLYNSSLPGLNPNCGCGAVGIYNSSGTLLASAQVTNTDPSSDYFNFASISPITLAAGQTYYVVGETGSADYTWDTNGFGVSPEINFIQDAYAFSSTLAFPTSSEGITAGDGGGIFGANFEIAAEPSTLALLFIVLLGSGIMAFQSKRCAA